MPHPVSAALRRLRPALLLALLLAPSLAAQEQFDKAEFAARRARLLERMPDGIAIVLAATEHPYPTRFRQSPDFYYLTGLEEPGAVLV
ncbi:MAG TPA: aminopeptidase P N-terminal domain-containing protein, partial [Gemmatimonadales bacterium]|nr:aminopeptidase P N-terminal domain-containing protein [Gemmatimonadales bacterium]